MREGARRAKSKHAADGKKSGGFLKFLIFAIIFIIIVAISTFVWYNISLSGTGTSEEQVSFEIGLGIYLQNHHILFWKYNHQNYIVHKIL